MLLFSQKNLETDSQVFPMWLLQSSSLYMWIPNSLTDEAISATSFPA